MASRANDKFDRKSCLRIRYKMAEAGSESARGIRIFMRGGTCGGSTGGAESAAVIV